MSIQDKVNIANTLARTEKNLNCIEQTITRIDLNLERINN
jgi:hypothetical protein